MLTTAVLVDAVEVVVVVVSVVVLESDLEVSWAKPMSLFPVSLVVAVVVLGLAAVLVVNGLGFGVLPSQMTPI